MHNNLSKDVGDAITEKKMNLLTTKVALSAVGIVAVLTRPAFAQQLPQYEVAGFPISPHQFSVLGSRDVQEQSFSPTLTLDGMPASPHQIAVIGRSKQQMADKLRKRRIWNRARAWRSSWRQTQLRGLASVPQIVRTGLAGADVTEGAV